MLNKPCKNIVNGLESVIMFAIFNIMFTIQKKKYIKNIQTNKKKKLYINDTTILDDFI